MSDADRMESFMVLAREDLKAADLIKVAAPRQAAFFLQQAVEKIGKALLIREGIDPQRIHAIGTLAAELPVEHPLRAKLTDLDRLTIFSTVTRYPSPTGRLPEPPRAEALANDIDIASELLAHARAHLGLEASKDA
jgi:HEPN domain-containing protein